MKSLGIDIGTTTISAAVLEDGCFITSETCKNNSFLAPTLPGERIQDAQLILDTALRTADMLFARYPDIERIGVTGQMHGILYLDGEANAVSPLYTWQDARGDAPCEKSTDGQSWTAYLNSETGLSAATGYGLVTHAYNLAHGLVPTGAVTLCTIGDYIAMKLCGRQTPVMDASNAAGLGFFDAEKRTFNQTVLRSIGIDPAFLPGLTEDRFIGICRSRARVAAAIGDNQASFLSAVRDREHEMLVNVGTGSQFSVFSSRCMTVPGLETRPMPGGGWLLAGAALCGGRAYALLADFFAQTARMMGMDTNAPYAAMEGLLKSAGRPEDVPTVLPLFEGTRQDSMQTGSITGLTAENFTPLHLIYGMMDGMAHELHQMYQAYRAAGGTAKKLIGSGGGLRNNRFLCESVRLRDHPVRRQGRGGLRCCTLCRRLIIKGRSVRIFLHTLRPFSAYLRLKLMQSVH